MQLFLGRLCASVFFACVIVVLPLSPLLLSLLTGKGRFARNYYRTITRLLITLDAMRERHSVERYVQSLLFVSRAPQAKKKIGGFCSHCGNCCLDRRCLFLEKGKENEYFCGIFGTTLRRLTSCGAYPIDRQDIDLYACPTYYVIGPAPAAPRPVVPWFGGDLETVLQSVTAEEGRDPAIGGVWHGNLSAATRGRETAQDQGLLRSRE